MANRPDGLNLSGAEIQALRRMAREARGLSGRSLADQLAALSKLVDRMELATLAALENSRDAPSAHTSASIPDTPQYREAVAEYYRRLGGSCTNAEGARAC
jgi:transcriptional regulator with XRE-family HTH domain